MQHYQMSPKYVAYVGRRVFKPHYALMQYMYARAFFFVQGDLLCD